MRQDAWAFSTQCGTPGRRSTACRPAPSLASLRAGPGVMRRASSPWRPTTPCAPQSSSQARAPHTCQDVTCLPTMSAAPLCVCHGAWAGHHPGDIAECARMGSSFRACSAASARAVPAGCAAAAAPAAAAIGSVWRRAGRPRFAAGLCQRLQAAVAQGARRHGSIVPDRQHRRPKPAGGITMSQSLQKQGPACAHITEDLTSVCVSCVWRASDRAHRAMLTSYTPCPYAPMQSQQGASSLASRLRVGQRAGEGAAHRRASMRTAPCRHAPQAASATSAASVPRGRYTRVWHTALEQATKAVSPSRRHSSSGRPHRGQDPSGWPPGGSSASPPPPPPAARGKNCATSASMMPAAGRGVADTLAQWGLMQPGACAALPALVSCSGACTKDAGCRDSQRLAAEHAQKMQGARTVRAWQLSGGCRKPRHRPGGGGRRGAAHPASARRPGSRRGSTAPPRPAPPPWCAGPAPPR